jgi:hypothetical protein
VRFDPPRKNPIVRKSVDKASGGIRPILLKKSAMVSAAEK